MSSRAVEHRRRDRDGGRVAPCERRLRLQRFGEEVAKRAGGAAACNRDLLRSRPEDDAVDPAATTMAIGSGELDVELTAITADRGRARVAVLPLEPARRPPGARGNPAGQEKGGLKSLR